MIDLAWWDFAALEGLRADDRLRVLSREAMAVMFRLVLVARAGGEVPYLNHHSGAQSVAVYDLRESDTMATRDACARAVKELVDVGLVALDDAARVIRLDLHAGVLAREVEVVAGADVAESGGPRRAPSHSPERNALRKLQWQFRNRTGPFTPAKVSLSAEATWESWSVSAEGVAFLARLEQAREQGRNNPRNKAEQPRNNPEQAPSPTPPSPESKGKEETEGARVPSEEQGGNKSRNKAAEQGKEQPPRRRRTSRVPAADAVPLPGTAAREVYDAIVGDPVLQPITTNPGDFATRCCSGAYPHLAPSAVAAVVRRCGEYAAREPGRYIDGRRALSNWLKEEDARAAARPRPAPAQAPKHPAPPRPVPIPQQRATAEQIRAMRAALVDASPTEGVHE